MTGNTHSVLPLIPVIAVMFVFALVMLFSAWDGKPFTRLYYTKRRCLRNELSDLDKQLTDYEERPVWAHFKTDDPDATGRVRSMLDDARARFAAGDLVESKRLADEAFDLFATQNHTLKFISVEKRGYAGSLGHCSLVDHYKSGRYLP